MNKLFSWAQLDSLISHGGCQVSSGWAALFESASASKKRSVVAHAGRCLNTACTMPEAVSTLLTMYTDCRPYYESSAERETD